MSSIIYEIREQTAILRVNRPAARNALNWAAQEAFAEVVTAVAQNPALRSLIITGTGSQAFVAGGDLKELNQNPDRAAGERLHRVMGDALARLTALPIPVIAAINGDAFGGGCEILTACDLRLTVPQARFSFAQTKVGLTTGWGGTARLVHLLGRSRALELLLTARLFDAPEAYRLGFVHRVLPPDEDSLTAALNWAAELNQLPATALAAAKALVLRESQSLHESRAAEKELFMQLWGQTAHLEALAAFNQRRSPIFNLKRSSNRHV